MAPQVGLEPTTKRLTAARSTAELLRNAELPILFLDKPYSLITKRLIRLRRTRSTAELLRNVYSILKYIMLWLSQSILLGRG